jgi:charged multivesicular body protein 1
MRSVSGSMGKVVQGMDVAMRTMDLERISAVMEKFEQQFTELDVQTGFMEDTMNDSTANTTPQDEVDLLLQKVSRISNSVMHPKLVTNHTTLWLAYLACLTGRRRSWYRIATESHSTVCLYCSSGRA